MNIEELEQRLQAVEAQLRVYQDKEQIERLQKAYGYYIEHWMSQELADLFAEGPDVSLHLMGCGTFQGKESVQKFFLTYNGDDPEFIHQVMQMSGIITVDPDGLTAKGRWNAWGVLALPMGGGVKQEFLGGMYENDYVKQDGVWKIKVARHFPTYYASPNTGMVAPERTAAIAPGFGEEPLFPDVKDEFEVVYPSGYILPFHFKHPVTGKESGEKGHNVKLGMEDFNW